MQGILCLRRREGILCLPLDPSSLGRHLQSVQSVGRGSHSAFSTEELGLSHPKPEDITNSIL